jgi:hypothetical protein
MIVLGGYNAGTVMVVGRASHRNYWFDANARYLSLHFISRGVTQYHPTSPLDRIIGDAYGQCRSCPH